MAELAEGTGSLGSPHPDPNLDGWPDPNTGWPNVNTTRMAKNNLKVSSNGDVCVLAVGRRTITTANAYQKMVKPNNGGFSAWNSFARVYDSQFNVPKYSSLVVGVWDTLTQVGGGNTDLYGIYKTSKGIICVGRQTADAATGVPNGNNIPVINVTPWGNAAPQNESAILVYYEATNLFNPNDSITPTSINEFVFSADGNDVNVYPNPASDKIFISFKNNSNFQKNCDYKLTDLSGRIIQQGHLSGKTIDVKNMDAGMYQLQIFNEQSFYSEKVIINRH